MGIPITHIIIITATTLMVTFHSIMISAIFAISTGVTTRLTIGEEDTDPYFLGGKMKARPFLALPFMVQKENRILNRWRHLDEMIKIHASGYIH